MCEPLIVLEPLIFISFCVLLDSFYINFPLTFVHACAFYCVLQQFVKVHVSVNLLVTLMKTTKNG